MDGRKRDPELVLKAAKKQEELVACIQNASQEEPETECSVLDVAALLESGVDASARDYIRSLYYSSVNYVSPLYHAARRGAMKTMELLLKHGADPNAMDRYCVTSLHTAAKHGWTACVKMLLDAGADINARTRYYLRDSRNISLATCESQPLMIRESVCLPYVGGTTPLQLAARHNQLECVKRLIMEGADYNAVNADGETSLYLAAAEGHPECVLVQLANAHSHPILAIPTRRDDTALHACLRSGEKMRQCVRELLLHGSDVCHSNNEGLTPMHLALEHGWDYAMIEYLIVKGYNMDFDRKGMRCEFLSPDQEAIPQISLDRPTIVELHRVNWPNGDGYYVAVAVTPGFGDSDLSGRYKTPLDYVFFVHLDQRDPSQRMTKNEDLAVLFIKFGATRNLLRFLSDELYYGNTQGPIFRALVDAYAYLPSLNAITTYERPQRYRRTMSIMSRLAANDERKKREDLYLMLRREVPSLQHLARSCVRSVLQQNLRKVVYLPVPTTIKEYILLGHQLPEALMGH